MKKKFFSSSTLKIIAMVAMFIDHFAAGLYDEIIMNINATTNTSIINYMLMRNIGRIAFPIFLFLLIQGFHHTHNLKKYIGRMALFAIISEVPFDMALKNSTVDWYFQNVYFELTLILIMFYFVNEIEKKYKKNQVFLLKILIVVATAIISELIHADYGMFGVLAAFIMFTLNRTDKQRALSIFPAFAFEMQLPMVFLASPLIYFYNGKKGLNLKYVFYAFYPLHLLLIAFIKIKLVTI